MSADRELLELAAKAYWSGEIDDVMSFHWDEQEAAIVYTHADNQGHNGNDVELLWNPLIDDGDALRLAVRLGLILNLSPRQDGRGQTVVTYHGVCKIEEPCDEGEILAARRAIVRAAAEIGKAQP